jgi:hypothetical protein
MTTNPTFEDDTDCFVPDGDDHPCFEDDADCFVPDQGS